MYQRQVWKDHVVEFPNRFKEVNLGNGLVEETPAPGEIIQQGTPQSARNFNNIEEGVLAGTEIADYLAVMVLQNRRGLETVRGECGTVMLTNTQTFPFNNSGKTVALATPRDTLDYFVNIEVVSETGGNAGTVTVYNKLANGFSIKFDGSAKSVTIRYNVTGGGI